MTKYLNPNNEGEFKGPQISKWTKWKVLLTQLSCLETKGTLGVYPIDMLHIVRTQFDDTMGLTTSNSGKMDDQGENDVEKVI